MCNILWKTSTIDKSIEVSSSGDIRKKGELLRLGNKLYNMPPQILKPRIYGKYMYVNFNGKSYSISKLVADVFVPNPNNLPLVSYKDGDTLHNESSNLEWISRSDNMKRSRRSESYRNSKGRSKEVRCDETQKTYPNIKVAVKEINETLKLHLNYDTVVRHINKNGEFNGKIHLQVTETNKKSL